MARQFLIRQGVKISGPMNAAELKRLAADGDLGPYDQVSGDGKKWVIAHTIEGLGLNSVGDFDRPFDVFISHSSQNKIEAAAVCAELEEWGMRCWIAPRDLLPGMEWGDGIVVGIDQCRSMVLIFSRPANESTQVCREIERAVSKGRPVIPFRLEKVRPNDDLQSWLGKAAWIDAAEPPLEPHIARLTKDVRRLLNRDRLAAAEQAIANRNFPRPAEEVAEPRRFRFDALREQTRLIAGIAAGVLIVLTLVAWSLGCRASSGQALGEASANQGPAVLVPLAGNVEAQVIDGRWHGEGDELVVEPEKTGALIMFGDPAWSHYDLTLKAMVVKGRDGFAVRFNVVNPLTFRKFHLGAFGNTYHVINTFVNDRYDEQHRRLKKGSMATNRWYNIRLEVRGAQCRCTLDGTTWFALADERLTQGRIGLSSEHAVVRFRDIQVTSQDGKTVLWQGNPRLPARR